MHDITRYFTIFTISNGIAKTRRDNQTKRVDKFICQRASADCSASILRTAKQSAKHHLPRGEARKEYNFDFINYKNAQLRLGIFYYLLDELRCNEICLWQNKSAYVDEIAIAMKSDFVGLWWQISYHPRLASDFI